MGSASSKIKKPIGQSLHPLLEPEHKPQPGDAPTPYEYAVMSEMAYYTAAQQVDPETWRVGGISLSDWKNRGWEFLSEKVVDVYPGFVWINHKTHQVVIAHRGTDGLLKIASEVKNTVYDPASLIEQQGFDAETFTEKTIKAIEEIGKKVSKKTSDYTLSFTGHSFGGWIAVLMARVFYEKYQARAIIFDAPGTNTMEEALRSNLKDRSHKFDWNKLAIINYISPPNLINTCDKHWGRLIQIFPETNLANYSEIKRYFLYNLEQTGIAGMVAIRKTFDFLTGHPSDQKQVTNWPWVDWGKLDDLTTGAARSPLAEFVFRVSSWSVEFLTNLGIGILEDIRNNYLVLSSIRGQYVGTHEYLDPERHYQERNNLDAKEKHKLKKVHKYNVESLNDKEIFIRELHPDTQEFLINFDKYGAVINELDVLSDEERDYLFSYLIKSDHSKLSIEKNVPMGSFLEVISRLVYRYMTDDKYIKLKSVLNEWKNSSWQSRVVHIVKRLDNLEKNGSANDFLCKQLSISVKRQLQAYYQALTMERLLKPESVSIANHYVALDMADGHVYSQSAAEVLHKNSTDELDNGRKTATYQELYQTDAHIDLSQLFSSETKKLIVGRPGTGKSTLCKYIAQNCTNGKLWTNQFDWVFLIQLNKINRDNYEKRSELYNISDIIYRECFINQGISHVEWQDIWQKIRLDNNTKTLYILDGYDEIIGLNHKDTKDLWKLVEHLLQQDNVIVTTRPNHKLVMGEKWQYLEILGFNEKHINGYINGYFDNKKDLATKLQNLVDNNLNLYDFAKVPINLEMICAIWEYYDGTVEAHQLAKMTFLYEEMLILLLRIYLIRTHGIDTQYLTRKEVLENSNSQNVLTSLKELAYHTIEKGTVSIKSTDLPVLLRRELSNTHFISAISQGRNEDDVDYYFVHLTMQEYLAALYLRDQLLAGNLDAQEFIRNQKQHPRYEVILWFLAGLLRSDDLSRDQQKQSVRKVFFELLNKKSDNTLVNVTLVNLLALKMRCLEEMGLPKDLENIIEQTQISLCQELENAMVRADEIWQNTLIPHIQACLKFLELPTVQESLLRLINHHQPAVQLRTIRLLGQLGGSFSQVKKTTNKEALRFYNKIIDTLTAAAVNVDPLLNLISIITQIQLKLNDSIEAQQQKKHDLLFAFLSIIVQPDNELRTYAIEELKRLDENDPQERLAHELSVYLKIKLEEDLSQASQEERHVLFSAVINIIENFKTEREFLLETLEQLSGTKLGLELTQVYLIYKDKLSTEVKDLLIKGWVRSLRSNIDKQDAVNSNHMKMLYQLRLEFGVDNIEEIETLICLYLFKQFTAESLGFINDFVMQCIEEGYHPDLFFKQSIEFLQNDNNKLVNKIAVLNFLLKISNETKNDQIIASLAKNMRNDQLSHDDRGSLLIHILRQLNNISPVHYDVIMPFSLKIFIQALRCTQGIENSLNLIEDLNINPSNRFMLLIATELLRYEDNIYEIGDNRIFYLMLIHLGMRDEVFLLIKYLASITVKHEFCEEAILSLMFIASKEDAKLFSDIIISKRSYKVLKSIVCETEAEALFTKILSSFLTDDGFSDAILTEYTTPDQITVLGALITHIDRSVIEQKLLTIINMKLERSLSRRDYIISKTIRKLLLHLITSKYSITANDFYKEALLLVAKLAAYDNGRFSNVASDFLAQIKYYQENNKNKIETLFYKFVQFLYQNIDIRSVNKLFSSQSINQSIITGKTMLTKNIKDAFDENAKFNTVIFDLISEYPCHMYVIDVLPTDVQSLYRVVKNVPAYILTDTEFLYSDEKGATPVVIISKDKTDEDKLKKIKDLKITDSYQVLTTDEIKKIYTITSHNHPDVAVKKIFPAFEILLDKGRLYEEWLHNHFDTLVNLSFEKERLSINLTILFDFLMVCLEKNFENVKHVFVQEINASWFDVYILSDNIINFHYANNVKYLELQDALNGINLPSRKTPVSDIDRVISSSFAKNANEKAKGKSATLKRYLENIITSEKERINRYFLLRKDDQSNLPEDELYIDKSDASVKYEKIYSGNIVLNPDLMFTILGTTREQVKNILEQHSDEFEVRQMFAEEIQYALNDQSSNVFNAFRQTVNWSGRTSRARIGEEGRKFCEQKTVYNEYVSFWFDNNLPLKEAGIKLFSQHRGLNIKLWSETDNKILVLDTNHPAKNKFAVNFPAETIHLICSQDFSSCSVLLPYNPNENQLYDQLNDGDIKNHYEAHGNKTEELRAYKKSLEVFAKIKNSFHKQSLATDKKEKLVLIEKSFENIEKKLKRLIDGSGSYSEFFIEILKEFSECITISHSIKERQTQVISSLQDRYNILTQRSNSEMSSKVMTLPFSLREDLYMSGEKESYKDSDAYKNECLNELSKNMIENNSLFFMWPVARIKYYIKNIDFDRDVVSLVEALVNYHDLTISLFDEFSSLHGVSKNEWLSDLEEVAYDNRLRKGLLKKFNKDTMFFMWSIEQIKGHADTGKDVIANIEMLSNYYDATICNWSEFSKSNSTTLNQWLLDFKSLLVKNRLEEKIGTYQGDDFVSLEKCKQKLKHIFTERSPIKDEAVFLKEHIKELLTDEDAYLLLNYSDKLRQLSTDLVSHDDSKRVESTVRLANAFPNMQTATEEEMNVLVLKYVYEMLYHVDIFQFSDKPYLWLTKLQVTLQMMVHYSFQNPTRGTFIADLLDELSSILNSNEPLHISSIIKIIFSHAKAYNIPLFEFDDQVDFKRSIFNHHLKKMVEPFAVASENTKKSIEQEIVLLHADIVHRKNYYLPKRTAGANLTAVLQAQDEAVKRVEVVMASKHSLLTEAEKITYIIDKTKHFFEITSEVHFSSGSSSYISFQNLYDAIIIAFLQGLPDGVELRGTYEKRIIPLLERSDAISQLKLLSKFYSPSLSKSPSAAKTSLNKNNEINIDQFSLSVKYFIDPILNYSKENSLPTGNTPKSIIFRRQIFLKMMEMLNDLSLNQKYHANYSNEYLSFFCQLLDSVNLVLEVDKWLKVAGDRSSLASMNKLHDVHQSFLNAHCPTLEMMTALQSSAQRLAKLLGLFKGDAQTDALLNKLNAYIKGCGWVFENLAKDLSINDMAPYVLTNQRWALKNLMQQVGVSNRHILFNAMMNEGPFPSDTVIQVHMKNSEIMIGLRKVFLPLHTCNEQGQTLLHQAIEHNLPLVARWLIIKGISVFYANKADQTAPAYLYKLIEQEAEKIVRAGLPIKREAMVSAAQIYRFIINEILPSTLQALERYEPEYLADTNGVLTGVVKTESDKTFLSYLEDIFFNRDSPAEMEKKIQLLRILIKIAQLQGKTQDSLKEVDEVLNELKSERKEILGVTIEGRLEKNVNCSRETSLKAVAKAGASSPSTPVQQTAQQIYNKAIEAQQAAERREEALQQKYAQSVAREQRGIVRQWQRVVQANRVEKANKFATNIKDKALELGYGKK